MKKTIIKILKYLLVLGLGLFLLLLTPLIIQSKNIKNYVEQMQAGKNSLENAVNNLKKQDYQGVKKEAFNASESFNEAENSLLNIRKNKLANKLAPLSASISDLEYLTKTSEILSKSLLRSSNILVEIDTVTSGRFKNSFSSLSDSDRQKILEIVYQSSPELTGLKANLQLSLDNLRKIHRIGILLPFNKQLGIITSQIELAKDTLDKLVPLIQLLPVLSGYPQESNLLVILQNNDELRPSGGFIGTYGLMSIKDAKPNKITTEDVYHLDMPCIDKLKVEPPAPIKKYMGVTYWWLRDANWSPDFPSSAKQIQSMFLAESGCTGKPANQPTAVIAINPDLIVDLLKIVGPITVEGETYDSSNFQPLLQYNVEIAYKDKDITSWDRKNIINSVVSELESRLTNLSSDKWPALISVMQSNVEKRNLQIYFENDSWEEIARSLGLAGEVKNNDQDYLMVVDANLAAFKSDSVMEKKFTYSVKENDQGISSKISLNYKHTGGFDWRTTRYRSYTRIYVPLGSRLIGDTDLSDFSVFDDQSLNKTVFGFFWSIEPGQEKTVSLNYTLPNNIKASSYHLYFQKQSGSRLKEFQYNKNLKNQESYHWSGAPEKDQNFY
jgi:hypothetical protein